jgi:hypothetical protein
MSQPTYIKTGRRPRRTSGNEKVTNNNTKINEFFSPSGDGGIGHLKGIYNYEYTAKPGVTEVDGTVNEDKSVVTAEVI